MLLSNKTLVLSMSRRATPPITLPEYERLFRIIHAVLSSEKGDLSKACLFFAVAGAYLLNRHHKLKSVCPVAGMAGYNLQTSINELIVLGTIEDGKPASDADHFHCWIEADGWIVDLNAPLFDAMAPAERKEAAIPPLMFQKPMLAKASVEHLNTPSAYIQIANNKLTTALMNGFTEKIAYMDLVRVCDQWYTRPPKKIAPSIGIADQHGKTREVCLSPIRLKGAW